MLTFAGSHSKVTKRSGKHARPSAKLRLLELEDRTLLSYSFTPIDVPGAIETEVYGNNDAGQIVGAYRAANNVVHGFLLNGGNYTTIDPPGTNGTNAAGINASGQISGIYGTGSRNFGFLLSG